MPFFRSKVPKVLVARGDENISVVAVGKVSGQRKIGVVDIIDK
jgi:hypothetical protein